MLDFVTKSTPVFIKNDFFPPVFSRKKTGFTFTTPVFFLSHDYKALCEWSRLEYKEYCSSSPIRFKLATHVSSCLISIYNNSRIQMCMNRTIEQLVDPLFKAEYNLLPLFRGFRANEPSIIAVPLFQRTLSSYIYIYI